MDNKSTKFIKSNKRFFVEDAVESFTFSDDSDDEGMGTSSKNYEKSFSRGNDSKGGRKYADSDDGEDEEIYGELFERDRMANADVLDDTNVVPFSDEEDEDFESDGRLVVSRKTPPTTKANKERARRSIDSSGSTVSDIDGSYDSEQSPSFEQHARVSPSKIAEVVCEDVFDDISSDEEEPRDGPRRRKGSNNTKTIESKMEAKGSSPKGRNIQQHTSRHTKSTTSSGTKLKDEHNSNSSRKSEKQNMSKDLNSKSDQISKIYKYGFCRRDNQFTRCVLERRYLGPAKIQPIFVLYLQDETLCDETAIFAAQKKLPCKTPNYHIFDLSSSWLTKGDDRDIWKGLNKKDDNYVGKLRGYKDEYTLYGSELHRQSYAAVCFGKSKRFVSKKNAKPRSVRAFLPILNEKGRVSRSMISSKPMVDTLKEKIKNGEEDSKGKSSDYVLLGNKLPQFRGGSYRLNFGGRVRWASVKNFQLCNVDSVHLTDTNDTNTPDDVILQMGKYNTHRFHVDFKYPMTAFQALGICLAQFARNV